MSRTREERRAASAGEWADRLHELADELAEWADDNEETDALLDRALDALASAEGALEEYRERLMRGL